MTDASAPTTLVAQQGAWFLDFERCPADADFGRWLEYLPPSQPTIFHMGPGGHHHIGRQVSESESGFVLSITCCVEEMQLYAEWAIQNPQLTDRYQVLFGDIQKLNSALLPDLDIVTLFHLGEMPDERRDLYGARSPYATARMFAAILARTAYHARPGWLIFYRRSAAGALQEEVAARLVAEGRMVPSPADSERYPTLDFYRTT